MNADAFRQLYDYHFATNRRIWGTHIAGLPHEQFIQEVDYSVGSVHNQVVHMMSCDNYWFSALTDREFPEMFDPADFPDRKAIRARWASLEQKMRDYLAKLRDEMLFARPFPDGDDEALVLWQVLLHVVNHGTDHRSQLLRLLHDLGVETGPQDYIFYVYEHL
ncbi:MAG: DinB family protein [Anaerolineae bacterium]|nr:DinB family protein [Anaerolineae bacterium]